MASSYLQSRSLMCFSWKNQNSGKRFFLNCISDPRELSSIKLTEFLLQLSKISAEIGKIFLEGSLRYHDYQDLTDIEATILASFDAWYGDNRPRIYLTEDGKDLVMNIYIYKEHAQALIRLSSKRPAWTLFVLVTQRTIHKRILDVMDKPEDMSKLCIFNCGRYRSTGAKAKVADIRLHLFGASGASAGSGSSGEQQRQQQPGPRSSFKVGDHLFTFGMIDKWLKRSVYYNVIVDDKPESIRLPRQMARFAGLSLVEARRLGDCQSIASKMYAIVYSDLSISFDKLYEKEGPAAYVGKDNDKNLIINIPLHVDHAQVMMKFLKRFWRYSFFELIADIHREYFLKESNRDDLHQNNHMDNICGEPKLQAIGRKATKDEIYSLMLQEDPQSHMMLECFSYLLSRTFMYDNGNIFSL